MRALNIIKDLKVLLYSVYFNFRYLPMKQAFRLPILVYKLNYMGGVKY